jgi:hypothetical protein
MNGQHGQSRVQQQPGAAAANVVTASKTRNFFIVLNLLRKQLGDFCLGRAV